MSDLMLTASVLAEIQGERTGQDAKWGEQNWPDGTGRSIDQKIAKVKREACDQAVAAGHVTWRHILAEEVAEAFAEADPARLRGELLQVAAVAVNWVEAIDRRFDHPDGPAGGAA